MHMSVMKEPSSQWFISAYDHILFTPDIVKNKFKEAGITEALEKGLPEADSELDHQDLSENDPFSLDSDQVNLINSCTYQYGILHSSSAILLN